MATAGDITVKFGVDLADFEKKIIKAEKNLKQMGERFERIGSGMTSLVTGPLAGFAASMTALAVKSGAVEKEQKKLEASMDKLGASVADVVGPAMEAAADIASDMAKQFSALDTEQKKSVITIGAVAAAIGPVSSGIGKMIKTVVELSAVLRAAVFAHPFLALAAAATAAAYEIIKLNELTSTQKVDQAAKKAQNEANVYIKRAAATKEAIDKEQALIDAGKGNLKNLEALQKKYDEQVASARKAHSAAQDASVATTKHAESVSQVAGATVAATAAADQYAQAIEPILEKMRDYAVEAIAAFQQSDMLERYGGNLRNISEEWDEASESLEKYTTRMNALWAQRRDSIAESDWASPELRESGAEALGMVGTNVTSMIGQAFDTIMPGIGSAISPIIDALSKGEEEARKELDAMFQGMADALTNITKNIDVLFETLISNLPEMFKAVLLATPRIMKDMLMMIGGLFEDIGQWLGQAFRDAGESIANMFKQAGEWVGDLFKSAFEDIINWFIDILNKIPGVSIAHVGDRRGSGDPMAYLTALSNIEPRAVGGPVNAGSPYLVGERGPELFVPQASGAIMPNDAMGGITINIQGGRDDAETIARKTVRAIRDARRLGLLDVNMLAGVGSA